MEVKPGYKQTEVGVIPEDWETPPLGALFSFKNGLNKGKEFFGYGTPIVNYMDVYGHTGIRASDLDGRVDVNRQELDSFGVRRGDVFFTRTSETVEEVGIASVLLDDSPNTVFSGFILRARPKNDALIDQLKKYCFSSSIFRKQIISKSTYTTRALTNGRVLSGVLLPIPPTKAEQEAIAGALSDADGLIESLEQLLAKKRNLKQGAMQELLTGKRRLPGFEVKPGYKQTEVGAIPQDWVVKLLPDVCRFRGGKAHEGHIAELGQFVCVNSKFISTDGKVRKYSSANFCRAKRDDILMVMSDLPNGKALAKAYLVGQDDLYAVNQRVCALTPYRDDSKYLFYILNRNPYFLKFDDGVNQTHLLNPVFKKCPLPLPVTKAEQTAIATILSDMDTEIGALEAKLTKARSLKQGMMQELLTGRIRLV